MEELVGRCFSDSNLLVVVADERHTDFLEFSEAVEQLLQEAQAAGARLRIPASRRP